MAPLACGGPPKVDILLESLLPNKEAVAAPPAAGAPNGLLPLGLEEGAALPNNESGTADGPELGVSKGDAPETSVAFP